MSDISIRPADAQDLDFLLEVMRTAATSHLPHCVWDVLFARPSSEVDALLAKVSGSLAPHWCHLDRFFVAEQEGRAIGAMTGFDTATEGTPALEQELLAIVGDLKYSDEELEAVLSRATSLGRGTPPNLERTWGIENVAIRADHRGSGAVDALLTHVLAVGRERGYETAQVLSLNGNDRARRAWMRNGFALVSDYRDVGFEETFGTPGMCLYGRPL